MNYTANKELSRMELEHKLCDTWMKCLFLWIVPFFFLVVAGTLPAVAGEISDMTGRTVIIPDKIEKVFAVSPPATFIVYALDPTAPIGVNFPLLENEKRYTVESFHALPVIGGLVGHGRTINKEVLLAAAPDVIVMAVNADMAVNRYYGKIFTRLNIPMVNIRIDTMDDYPEALLFMGELLGKKDRAEQLHRYALKSLQQVRTAVEGIPNDAKPEIYYAEGTDGLSTERSGSMHAELIELCGGMNVHRGKAFEKYTREKISMEQLILYDPDIVLIKERSFYKKIYTDPRWQRIKAVRERTCYLIPHAPFNWFDRPPSFMRLIGAKWLASLIHPERLPIDMVHETQLFFRLFLGLDMSENEAREVLGR